MQLSDNLAQTIYAGYQTMFAEFMRVTRGAQTRFEAAQWKEVHAAMRLRLTVYKQTVSDVEADCIIIARETLSDRTLWRDVKANYSRLIEGERASLIAESFFNSVYCRVFGHQAIRPSNVFSGVNTLDAEEINAYEVLKSFEFEGDLQNVVSQMLLSANMHVPFENLSRDVKRVSARIDEFFSSVRPAKGSITVRVFESIFYRNKGAYQIGYIDLPGEIIPIALPLMLNDDRKIYVDAVILGQDELSMIFSFTRSYFMVDASIPSRYVAILKRLMPNKEIFELFTAIGFAKHGKTVFFQHAVSYTRNIPIEQQYNEAPGIKGMVMMVFTLPDFGYVYKVIKDRFTPPKDMTRKQVEEKYAFVKRSDRAGRMADIYEFRYLAFDRRRFSEALLDELKRACPSQIKISGNALVLKHVYVERKMIPLNLYLPSATDEEIFSAIDEYGNAIKQLAAANIFPGDMLFKNFGVTRHGRVVFYDYDEICSLIDCHFREIPKAKNEEQEFSLEPWFDVKDNDVFPEEFRIFFTGNAKAKRIFNQLHAEIYNSRFWIGLQEKISQGEVADVFPYRRQKRFDRAVEG